ncbi:hypothetical protein GCM10009127_28410 [Alteraurantiacibacter aestuarii]|uniref:Uncharacterized protein n=1 Tax=Alteraurantiacibacter aestuarii TaxID=650004 RepID=A0A844ZKI3_9SPHN|nr:hypothetical protein [Alteraurantiacibacter aestuarii]MXO88951.1 hypothetical protein [Alteraurantiacibacter aestuarii]
MTPQARFRRIGWFAALGICTALYGVLHFQVWSLSSEVTKAERQIVSLEEQNMLLETEFLTRSRQIQLAAWNRVDFGYSAPKADQFIDNERELSRFASPRAAGAPAPIRLAGQTAQDEVKPFPRLVSPLTGRPVDVALVETGGGGAPHTTPLVARIAQQTLRIPLNANASASASAPVVRIALGDTGQ